MSPIEQQPKKLEWNPNKKLTRLEFDALAAQMRQEIEGRGWEWSTQDFAQGAIAFFTPSNNAENAQLYLRHEYRCLPAEDFEFEQNGKVHSVSDPMNDPTGFSPQAGRYKMFDADPKGGQKMFRLTVRNPE